MSYTPGQVGAANVPAAHSDRSAPALSTQLEQTGEDLASVPERAGFFASVLNWRQRGTRPAERADVALGDPQTERANAHAHAGSPDPRRQDTELNGHPSGESSALAPAVQDYTNTRRDVVLSEEAPPARARQGWTGEDNTRRARSQVAFLLRPFDKGIAEHPIDIVKAEFDAPRAALSAERPAVANPRPSAGGYGASNREGVGPRPNSFRLMPRAWDALLVNTGGPAADGTNDPAAGAQAARGRSFRL